MGSAFFEQAGQTGSKECGILPASWADQERQPLLPSTPLLRCERCPCTRSFTSRASPPVRLLWPPAHGAHTCAVDTDQALWTQRESASPPLERERQERQKQNSKTQTGPCRSGELFPWLQREKKRILARPVARCAWVLARVTCPEPSLAGGHARGLRGRGAEAAKALVRKPGAQKRTAGQGTLHSPMHVGPDKTKGRNIPHAGAENLSFSPGEHRG